MSVNNPIYINNIRDATLLMKKVEKKKYYITRVPLGKHFRYLNHVWIGASTTQTQIELDCKCSGVTSELSWAY